MLLEWNKRAAVLMSKQKPKQTKVLLGCGGLGNTDSQYLVVFRYSQLVLVDCDKVELSNLQQQILFRDRDRGFNKAKMATRQLKQLNPYVQIKAVEQHFSVGNAETLLANTDWVLDCTDNFQSRKLINKLCQHHQISLISAAAIARHFRRYVSYCTDPTNYSARYTS